MARRQLVQWQTPEFYRDSRKVETVFLLHRATGGVIPVYIRSYRGEWVFMAVYHSKNLIKNGIYRRCYGKVYPFLDRMGAIVKEVAGQLGWHTPANAERVSAWHEWGISVLANEGRWEYMDVLHPTLLTAGATPVTGAE